MNKKVVGVLVIIIIIILAVVLMQRKSSPVTETITPSSLKIGAVLPMTGPAAIWGETVKNGMELALEEKSGIQVVYEDSKGTPADGVSAFNRVQQEGVDITISELSSVSVPLAAAALQQKVPLLVTLSAASGIANDYTVRYYTNPTFYAEPSFSSSSPVIGANVKKLAILYRNDELGASVKDKLKELSDSHSKTIVYLESYKPNETDFLTLLTKVKGSGANALLFVASTPGEAVGIVKMATQLKLNIPIVESSGVFADYTNRAQVASTTFYSTSFDFTLEGKAQNFKERYMQKFGKSPSFGAAFGYDMVNLISQCKDEKKDIHQCLLNVKNLDGVAGQAQQVAPGDFAVPLHLEKVN